MSEVNLTFEIHCQRPPWAIKNRFSKFLDSRYRVYVNNDLITERNWNWDNNIFLKENIWINTPINTQHTLKIEPIVYIPEQAVFTVNDFKIVNVQADITKINDLQVNFTLR
jgi:hypothetical protein